MNDNDHGINLNLQMTNAVDYEPIIPTFIIPIRNCFVIEAQPSNNLYTFLNQLNPQPNASKCLRRVRVTTNTYCTICLYDIRKSTKVPKLKCHHKFHSKCIQKWLKHHRNCPICREQDF